MRRVRAVLTALVLGGIGLAVVTVSSAAAERSATAFTIRSSLDGKTVLPHRIRWIAYPSARVVLFPGVEFLVDGKVVFADRLEPYAFAADGRDEASRTRKTGYLVTSWLAPGKHTFTVRGKAIVAGRRTTATSTVVARVAPRPGQPAQLAGTWRRELETAVPPDPNVLYRDVTAQPGDYRIVIDRRFIRMSGPAPREHLKIDYVGRSGTLTIRGPIWTGDPDEGAICDPWGPEATYSWSVSGRTLTLTSSGKRDACKQRSAIVAGEWTRVK